MCRLSRLTILIKQHFGKVSSEGPSVWFHTQTLVRLRSSPLFPRISMLLVRSRRDIKIKFEATAINIEIGGRGAGAGKRQCPWIHLEIAMLRDLTLSRTKCYLIYVVTSKIGTLVSAAKANSHRYLLDGPPRNTHGFKPLSSPHIWSAHAVPTFTR